MTKYPKLGAKESDCWDVVLEPLHQRVADIQAEIRVMHSDPDFIHSDASEFLDLKKSLQWAENYLFQAKGVRAYVIRFATARKQRMIKLPKFSISTYCPKCGYDHAAAKYHKAPTLQCPCPISGDSGDGGEHILRTCLRCGYKWAEECLKK